MNQFYYELRVTPDVYYELFVDLILSLTNEAIEERDGSIIIRSEEDLRNIKLGIEAFVKELSTAFKTTILCDITINQYKNEDWIKKYQDSVKAIEVGEFFIHPSWEEDRDDKLNIIIDPALTFGSGHHESTNSCLKGISTFVKNGDKILDVGCGSGILAIGCAKLGAVCDICDTDPLAIEDALKNFKRNGVEVERDWEGSANKGDKRYDVVIANIVADVLIMINKDLKNCLNDNGILILSGILDKYKDKVLAKFNDLEIKELIHKNEWITIILRRS